MSSPNWPLPLRSAHRVFHRYFLLQAAPDCALPRLETDLLIKLGLYRARRRRWNVWLLLRHGVAYGVIVFVFAIFPALFALKLPLLAILSALLIVPATAQFFVPALPILAWISLFFLASKIPVLWKPAISVKFLPAMETILYGDNLSNVLAETNNSFLDVLAWLPYGIIHFALPFFVAFFIFMFAPPTSLRSFGFAFGYMNLAGVLIQLLFPAAPPWYKNLHGLEPANYGMDGSPGGLGRIDALFGVDMYTLTFSNSPLVFGAFPLLHAGCAVMDVLFLCWLFPKLTVVWWGYACVLWWLTMYLTHHYFIDLICGAVLSYTVFTYIRYTRLPVVDPSMFCRWLYRDVVYVDAKRLDPLNFDDDDAPLALAPLAPVALVLNQDLDATDSATNSVFDNDRYDEHSTDALTEDVPALGKSS